jgi:hypothetical protein
MEELTSDKNGSVTDCKNILFDFLMKLQGITLIEQFIQISVIVGGIPIKLIVLFVLIYPRHFHFPRPIYWPVISFLKCAFLFQCIVEMALIIARDNLVSRSLVLIAPTIYFFVLLVLSISILNRYLVILRNERCDDVSIC